ncbi:MAG: tetratricopeptide repeat protein [Aureispira sp.]
MVQTSKEIAWKKAREAVKLMDEGQIEESINILKECERLDPEEYTYSYEVAYAHILVEDYKTAIKILKKTTKYPKINSQVYQTLGNPVSFIVS